MSEWEEAILGDLIDIKHGWAFKGEFFKETTHPTNIVVAIGNFNYSGGFRFDSTRTKEYLDSYPQEYELTPGDILLAMTCQTAGGKILGIPGRIPTDSRIYLHNQRLGKVEIKNKKTTNPSFIYWLCLWQNFNHHLVATATGTKILHTAPERIKSFTFKCPPIDEQKQIGKTLDALHRKIENLRRQNETLERIAQTLFKHWFVDFEFPNEDGKPYKSSGGEMVRSELGEIPAGWHVGKLRDLFTLNYGKSLTLENRVPGQYPVVGSSGVVGSHQSYLVNAPGIVIGRKGTIGQVIWLEDNFYPIDTTFYVEDIFGCEGLYFYYFLLKRQDFQRLTSDSAVPGLNRDMAYSIEIVIPEIAYIDRFNTVVKAIFDKIYLNQRQIRTLTKTRDVLLPKLMSGKLRIETEDTSLR